MKSPWRSVGAWTGLVVCLLLVAAVTLARPDLTDDQFTVITADAEGTAQTNAFDVRVESVGLAREVVPREGATAVATQQQWVVVRYHMTAHRERLRTDQVWLITADGDRYAARDEFRNLTRGTVDAGFQHVGSVVFEVPPDAVAGAVLQFGPAHQERRPWDVVVRHDPGFVHLAVEPVITPRPPEVGVAR